MAADANANANADARGSTIVLRELCSGELKRIGSKATEKRWRHHFPHYKSMGVFCCHGHQSFDPICLKTLCSLSPLPVMLHIKFDQDWPTGLRDIQVRSVKFSSFKGNSKVSGLIRPEIKLIWAFMPVLVTSNFDVDSIKNEQASMETEFPKTLCSLSLTPVMLHIKFDQDWPTGFRDIKVWKCVWPQTTNDDRPLVY